MINIYRQNHRKLNCVAKTENIIMNYWDASILDKDYLVYQINHLESSIIIDRHSSVVFVPNSAKFSK